MTAAQLSSDVLLHTFQYLSPMEWYPQSTLVCKQWHQTCESDAVFSHLLSKLRVTFWQTSDIVVRFEPHLQNQILSVQNMSMKQLFAATWTHIVKLVRTRQKLEQEISVLRAVEQAKFSNPMDYIMHSMGRAGCHPPDMSNVPEQRPPVTTAASLGIPVKGFKVHPDSNLKELTVQFSVDQFQQMCFIMYSDFANSVETVDYDTMVAKGALNYYHKFMILSVKYPTLFLVPPQQVVHCWYSHLTRPVLYQQYCKQLIDKYGAKEHADLFKQRYHVVPTNNFVLNQMHFAVMSQAWQQTLNLWQQEFNEPMFPSKFALPTENLNACTIAKSSNDFRAAITYTQNCLLGVNLLSDKKNTWSQLKSHYSSFKQVDVMVNINPGMVMEDLKFFAKVRKSVGRTQIVAQSMHMVLKSYERYLYLLTILPNAAPSYMIDLAWHTHMCNPVAYIKDTCTLFGQVLDHDPTYMPTAAEENKVKQAWKSEYNTEVAKDHSYYIPVLPPMPTPSPPQGTVPPTTVKTSIPPPPPFM